MKDSEIVDMYWNRNEDALRQTQSKYGAYLSKVAYNILADFEDCKECVNDTYMAAWNSMPTHRPGNLATYLGKITRQITIDMFSMPIYVSIKADGTLSGDVFGTKATFTYVDEVRDPNKLPSREDV